MLDRMRPLFLALVSAAASASFVHCSTSYGEDDPAVPGDSGANASSVEGGLPDGAPPDIGAPDAGDASFCSRQRDALLCEDFEGAFPPAGWGLGVTTDITLSKVPGFESGGAFEASFVGKTDAGFVSGLLTHGISSPPTSIRVLADVYVERDDPPVGESGFLALVFPESQFLSLGTRGEQGVLVITAVGKAPDGGPASSTFVQSTPHRTWTEMDIRLAVVGSSAMLEVLVNGSVVLGVPVPLNLGAPSGILLGYRTDRSFGSRIVRLDNVVVTAN